MLISKFFISDNQRVIPYPQNILLFNSPDGDSERMRIRADGKVGIGTSFGTSPSDLSEYNLFVSKGVRTEKAPKSPKRGLLLPLQRRGFHKHLPDIPSAKELEEKGMDIGEMHRLQMQKIEEMMLYLIQLSKENQELKKRIEQLEKPNNKATK